MPCPPLYRWSGLSSSGYIWFDFLSIVVLNNDLTATEISKLTDEELRHQLITPDYKGTKVKELALEELLQRKYDEGFNVGEANERGDT